MGSKAALRRKAQPGNPGVELMSRVVDDPHVTDAIYYDKLARDRFNPDKVAKVIVLENAMSRIGALCYVPDRTLVQEHAAEVFKALYESLYGAQPAMDMGNPVVDTSPIAHDAGMASRVDRGADMQLALKTLGRARFNRVVATVCMGISFKNQGYSHWRAKQKAVKDFLGDLEVLAEAWKLKTKGAA